MNFSDLKTELLDRGFSDLTDTRAGRFINDAKSEFDGMFRWPWLEAFVTGTAPLQVDDLGVIEAVIDETQGDVQLDPGQWRSLLRQYGDLSTAGTPLYYYTAWPDGLPEVALYPTSSNQISVQYWKVTEDLTGTDTPESPTQAHPVIVDIAERNVRRILGDAAGVELAQAEVDRKIDRLLEQYPPGIADGQGYIVERSDC